MNVSDKIKNNFPSTLTKKGKYFTSLIVNDKKSGAIEQEVIKVVDYMKEWRNIKNLYNSSGTALEYLSTFFTYLEQFKDESDASYLDRIKAIFVRGNDIVWGTKDNIKNTFVNYFGVDTIYIVENTNDKSENRFLNYVFDDGENWNIVNASVSKDARFSKANGILFSENGYISQQVESTPNNKNYIHFFYKGTVTVEVENAKTYVWDNINEVYVEQEAKKTFTSEEWTSASFYFISTDANLTVKFSGTENTYFDYPMFFVKRKKPSFTVFVQFTGSTAKNALALAPGNADPTEEIQRYELAGYYDNAYMTGANSGFAIDLYKDLLNYVKAVGVKGYLEIVNRDQD